MKLYIFQGGVAVGRGGRLPVRKSVPFVHFFARTKKQNKNLPAGQTEVEIPSLGVCLKPTSLCAMLVVEPCISNER